MSFFLLLRKARKQPDTLSGKYLFLEMYNWYDCLLHENYISEVIPERKETLNRTKKSEFCYMLCELGVFLTFEMKINNKNIMK